MKFAVLMFVAIVVTLSRQAEVNEEMGNARRLAEFLRKKHTSAGGAGSHGRTSSGGRTGARSRKKAA